MELGLLDLPVETLLFIASLLDTPDKCCLARVCRALRDVAYDDVLWQPLLVRFKAELVEAFLHQRLGPTASARERYIALELRARKFRSCSRAHVADAVAALDLKWREYPHARALSQGVVDTSFRVMETPLGNTMIAIRARSVVNAPLDRIFGVLHDYAAYPKWDRVITSYRRLVHIEEGVDVLAVEAISTNYIKLSTTERFENGFRMVRAVELPNDAEGPDGQRIRGGAVSTPDYGMHEEYLPLEQYPRPQSEMKFYPSGYFARALSPDRSELICLARHDQMAPMTTHLVSGYCALRTTIQLNLTRYCEDVALAEQPQGVHYIGETFMSAPSDI